MSVRSGQAGHDGPFVDLLVLKSQTGQSGRRIGRGVRARVGVGGAEGGPEPVVELTPFCRQRRIRGTVGRHGTPTSRRVRRVRGCRASRLPRWVVAPGRGNGAENMPQDLRLRLLSVETSSPASDASSARAGDGRWQSEESAHANVLRLCLS